MVDDIAFPVKMQNYQNYRMSSIDAVMQRKLSDALQDGKNEIQLKKSDFEGTGAKWDDTQETISMADCVPTASPAPRTGA